MVEKHLNGKLVSTLVDEERLGSGTGAENGIRVGLNTSTLHLNHNPAPTASTAVFDHSFIYIGLKKLRAVIQHVRDPQRSFQPSDIAYTLCVA
jgi:hypothetical protein